MIPADEPVGRDWPRWLPPRHIADLRDLERLVVSATDIAIALCDDDIREAADDLDGRLGELLTALERDGLPRVSHAVLCVQDSAQELGDMIRELREEVGL